MKPKRIRTSLPRRTAPPAAENLIEPEAAAFLRVEPQTLANWRSKGIGPVYARIGRRVVYTLADLIAFVHANRRTATTVPVAPAVLATTPTVAPAEAASVEPAAAESISVKRPRGRARAAEAR
jgi:helix-turn-helix protein